MSMQKIGEVSERSNMAPHINGANAARLVQPARNHGGGSLYSAGVDLVAEVVEASCAMPLPRRRNGIAEVVEIEHLLHQFLELIGVLMVTFISSSRSWRTRCLFERYSGVLSRA